MVLLGALAWRRAEWLGGNRGDDQAASYIDGAASTGIASG